MNSSSWPVADFAYYSCLFEPEALVFLAKVEGFIGNVTFHPTTRFKIAHVEDFDL